MCHEGEVGDICRMSPRPSGGRDSYPAPVAHMGLTALEFARRS